MLFEVNGKLVIELCTRRWCKLPYLRHPKGCPNYGKHKDCPPLAPLVSSVFDLSASLWFVVVKFDLKRHAKRMKKLHPEWTKKQCRCCLYWQNTVRKELRLKCEKFKEVGEIYTLIPEAMGVNVFETMKEFGIELERNPVNTIYKVALMGFPKKKEEKCSQLILE